MAAGSGGVASDVRFLDQSCQQYPLGFFRFADCGSMGIMEKKMETSIVHWGSMGIMY